MKFVVCEEPGKFSKKEMDAPVLEAGRCLLKIKRIGVCGTDLHAYKGNQPYFSYPRILGHELSGVIEAIDGNDEFKVGEEVTFIPYYSCGKCIACRKGKTNCCSDIRVCGVHVDGGMVEILSIPADALIKGEGISLDGLALVEPLAIGAHGVRRAQIEKESFVLVMGAGPIGLGTAHFAAIAGAKVIMLDLDQNRLDFCLEHLPIHAVINGKNEEVAEKLRELTGGDMCEVVIDATGNLKAMQAGFSYLAHGGRFVLIGLQKNEIAVNHPEFHKREASLMSSRNATREDFDVVIKAMSEGLVNPETYITHRLSFDEVADRFEELYQPDNGLIKAMISL
ncbi:MAG: zinc-binding alcohol dehydrogenase family protein [Saprospiraceae bacterium]|nr:zinc-binding alcohol dehydrogenase family protein [Saprospiraceae bacterium]